MNRRSTIDSLAGALERSRILSVVSLLVIFVLGVELLLASYRIMPDLAVLTLLVLLIVVGAFASYVVGSMRHVLGPLAAWLGFIIVAIVNLTLHGTFGLENCSGECLGESMTILAYIAFVILLGTLVFLPAATIAAIRYRKKAAKDHRALRQTNQQEFN